MGLATSTGQPLAQQVILVETPCVSETVTVPSLAQEAALAFRQELHHVREVGDALLFREAWWDVGGGSAPREGALGAHPAELSAEDIHEMRKGLKRLRALNGLLRGARSRSARRACRQRLRDAGQVLAELRRGTALLGCVARLAQEDGLSVETRVAAEKVLSDLHRASHASLCCAVRAALYLLEELEEPPEPSMVQLEKALGRQLRRVRRARDATHGEPSDELLHDLRKRVKAYRVQLKQVAPETEAIAPLAQWAELLGQVHDLADLEQIFEQSPLAQTSEGRAESTCSMELAAVGQRARCRLVARAQEVGAQIDLVAVRLRS